MILLNPIVREGLVGWWPLMGNCMDYSGHSNNGTNSGAIITRGNKLYPASYGFNGSSSKVVETVFSLFPSGTLARTVTVWFLNLGTSAVSKTIFNYGENSNSYGRWQIYYKDTTKEIGCEIQGSLIKATNLNIPTNKWTFACTVLPNNSSLTSQILIYINGVKCATSTTLDNTINTITNKQLNIGWNNFDSNPWFSGSISDVRIYNRALTPNEIMKLYKYSPKFTNPQNINLQSNIIRF